MLTNHQIRSKKDWKIIWRPWTLPFSTFIDIKLQNVRTSKKIMIGTIVYIITSLLMKEDHLIYFTIVLISVNTLIRTQVKDVIVSVLILILPLRNYITLSNTRLTIAKTSQRRERHAQKEIYALLSTISLNLDIFLPVHSNFSCLKDKKGILNLNSGNMTFNFHIYQKQPMKSKNNLID